MTSNLEWLQQFYLSFCNGDWEHGFAGCTIENVDNPGWSFKFELAETVYEDVPGPEVRVGEDLTGDGPDWILLKKDGSKIEGACGPLKLDQLIGEFRSWVEKVEPMAAHIEKQWHAEPIKQVDNDPY
ncbi:Imm53 family immunity protein [Sphingomonas sp.]|uniref:Imm53 family immunity protein n=1 Tax=Sphingomonas sp. TaxID=28214 RepID=UPI0017EF2D8B|nr:Imm53 family immunity protein [Sphingomonas sp.]MBA3512518.1 immunity 53 family protein [Sphingomonas sp.]